MYSGRGFLEGVKNLGLNELRIWFDRHFLRILSA